MAAKEILKQLDDMAEDYEFPILDNYNFDLAQSRLSVFKKNRQWLLIFEIVGYAPEGFQNILYAFGNCLNKKGIIIGVDDIVSLHKHSSLFDAQGNFVVNPFDIQVKIMDKKVMLNPTKEDYEKVNIDVSNFNPTKLIRFLSTHYQTKLWLDEGTIFSEVGLNSPLPLFFRTEEWNHADISSGEKPSENEFFKQLAVAIENDDPTIIQIKNPNTHWSHWTWSDFENQ